MVLNTVVVVMLLTLRLELVKFGSVSSASTA